MGEINECPDCRAECVEDCRCIYCASCGKFDGLGAPGCDDGMHLCSECLEEE